MKLVNTLASALPFASVLNITWYQDLPLVPTPLPLSHADSDGEQIIELFQNLGRTTVWKSVANISFEGDTFEPEGIVRLGDDRFILSGGHWIEPTKSYGNGTIIDGTDRTTGKGFSHLIVYDGKGKRIADATITRQDVINYHNGGIDYDGEFIWGAVAQYRPNTTAFIYKADPSTLKPEVILHYNDHLGGVVHDPIKKTVTGLNWGSRNATTWQLTDGGSDCSGKGKPAPEILSVVRNPGYFIDYQDCKWLGHSTFYNGRSVMLCAGVAGVGNYNLGGIALVDVETMVALAEVPIALTSALGVRMTQNPVDANIVDGKLRLYWLPDQHNSTLYVYEAQPNSPFEYGGDGGGY